MKINISRFVIDYIICSLVILSTRSIYSAASEVNFHIDGLLIIFLTLRIMTLPFFKSRKIGKYILFSLIWCIYILIFGIAAKGEFANLSKNFIVIFLLLAAYYIAYASKYSINKLFEIYANIMIVLAIISLVFWIFGSVFNFVSPISKIAFYWGKDRVANNYYYLYFEWQNDAKIFNTQIYRNTGLFTEAPMYSLHLSVAFLFDYLILKRRNKYRMLVYILTIISTVSVTGILLVFATLFLEKTFMHCNDLMTKGKVKISFLIWPVICCALFVVGSSLLISKLQSASGSSRVEDYVAGFRGWMDNPLFGAGYGDITARMKYMSAARISRAENGFTNSPMTVLCEGGIYFFSCYLVSFIYLMVLFLKNRNFCGALFTTMWLYLFIVTTFAHTTLMLSFMAYVFACIIEKNSMFKSYNIKIWKCP